MVIRIVSDVTYGHLENGIVKPKTKKSEPFQVDDANGKRLISLGIAKEVTEAPKQEYHLDEGQLLEMSINELRALAKDMQLSASGSKAEIVARIVAEPVGIEDDAIIPADEIEGEAQEDGAEVDADEEPPVLEAAEPEV